MIKKPGRPPLDRNDPSVSVTIRVPSKTYEKWYVATRRDRLSSIGEFVRRELSDQESKRSK